MTGYAEVLEKYRQAASDIPGKPISFELFAKLINTHLHPKYPRTWAHWRAVAAGNYSPAYYEMWWLAEFGKGWVKDFGLEMAGLLGAR